MSRVLLCVDMSYQVYRAAAAHPMLTSRRVFTGGLYGFMTTFAKMVRETQATHVAFCQDVKPYKRSEVYPEYKQIIRKKAMDENLKMMYSQSMKLVLECLEECGLKTWGIPGFESDDIIAHCVNRYGWRFDRIYAGSNDSDLFQLLDAECFRIYKKDLKDCVSLETLRKRGLTPAEYMLMTALTGTHNDVEGIVGVGDVTAQKIVKSPALLRQYRERHGALIDRNLSLIKLPHADFPREAKLPRHEGFNPRQLYRSLGRYDIDVTGAMVSAFDQIRGEK